MKKITTLLAILIIFSACYELREKPDIVEKQTPPPAESVAPAEITEPVESTENATSLLDRLDEFEANAEALCEKITSNDPAEDLKAPLETLMTEHEGIVGIKELCEGAQKYAIFETDGPGVMIGVLKEGKFELFKNAEEAPSYFGAMKFDFFPEVMGDKSLVYEFYGDTVQKIWKFYELDPQSMQAKLIESCEEDPDGTECEET